MGVDLSREMCVQVCECVSVYVCVCVCDRQLQGGVDGTEGQEGGRKRDRQGATTSERYRGIS